jgi:Zn-finger nucleic acid-binding protein
MTDRQGVEIDYCPQCRGVWLDRGELDKIMDRERQASQPSNSGRDDYRPDDDDHYRQQYGYRKKRRGFLGDLFDFD